MLFPVEKTGITDTTETYTITIRDHSITLQTNRLLFKKKNLKHRKGAWKVLEGQFKNPNAFDPITQAIERVDPIK